MSMMWCGVDGRGRVSEMAAKASDAKDAPAAADGKEPSAEQQRIDFNNVCRGGSKWTDSVRRWIGSIEMLISRSLFD